MNRELKHLIFTAVMADFGLRNQDIMAITSRKKEVVSRYMHNRISIPLPVLEAVCTAKNVDITEYQNKFTNDRKDARLNGEKPSN